MAVSDETLERQDLRRLAEQLGERCRARGITVTAAESCTGGGVASAITAVAGSSAWFETGYVTYANGAKTRLLGVPEALLAEHGAVSREVVEAMVIGACRDSGAALGVAISGVAGPGGGSAEKPVGMVWLAWGSAEGAESTCHRFPGDRAAVRERAVHEALVGLVRRLALP
ncbi:CinA family protein [Halomonas urmiana]|uniref:CinA family protein n=1 Tax=Halomonas urmiana TaxID=490901 RepID=A0A5R8MDE5_9GAMM|nr:nicotinamide-nucleotide amidohydrolase family protein [Halomonas urmiana]TLF47644.1 CinA family protein [Halomonas urmiana]